MTQFAWHVHHDGLLEPLTEPIENRIVYIKAKKPKNEQALRLRLLKTVIGTLPLEYTKAWDEHTKTRAERTAKYTKTRAEYIRAWAEHDKARAEYDKALAECLPEIEALHKLECPDCPWDGTTIFAGAEPIMPVQP